MTYTGTNGFGCGTPNPIKFPTGTKHCWTKSGNWFYIDMHEMFTINLLRFRIYDGHSNIYTYNLAVSSDRENWRTLAAGKVGTYVQEFRLDEPISIRYIKTEGRNNKDNYIRFILNSIRFDVNRSTYFKLVASLLIHVI